MESGVWLAAESAAVHAGLQQGRLRPTCVSTTLGAATSIHIRQQQQELPVAPGVRFQQSSPAAALATRQDAPGLQEARSPIEEASPALRRQSDACRTPQTSRSHIDVWGEAGESVIMFDWDDTLFPTRYVWNDERIKWDKVAPCFEPDGHPALGAHAHCSEGVTMREALSQHAKTVAALLRLAVTLGHVVIITLAADGWVDMSIRNFLPELQGLLEELQIDVIYCRVAVPLRYERMVFEEAIDLAKILKARAMTRVLKKFYGTGRSSSARARSWKNVLSVGDSAGERLAIQDVIWRRRQTDSRGAYKECRCKVLKLLDEPDLESLTAELQVVINWLEVLVLYDGDVDLDFEELEEDSPTSAKAPQRFDTPGRSPARQASVGISPSKASEDDGQSEGGDNPGLSSMPLERETDSESEATNPSHFSGMRLRNISRGQNPAANEAAAAGEGDDDPSIELAHAPEWRRVNSSP